ncbi:MAG: MarR family transcriptional regulator [Kutzneria sp.]|nr:MarR family transcriptional regulator [Kutzneria sp.]MBV9843783.1 MarR family transcriptional regulator [Kutzneria sp.]
MPRDPHEELLALLGAEVSATQETTDAADEAVAVYLGVNRTDLRCLSLLFREIDTATPGQLGTVLGLTTGSITAMVDRLERQGYLVRTPDPADRRKIVIRLTAEVVEQITALYRPLIEAGLRELARYTEAELELIIDFQRRSRRLQEEHRTRVLRTSEQRSR